MGKIVQMNGGKQNPKKEQIKFKDGRLHMEFSEGDNFLLSFVNQDNEGAKTYMYVDEPEQAIALLLCLMSHMQDAFECTKGELLSTIVEYFIDEDCGMEDDEDGN